MERPVTDHIRDYRENPFYPTALVPAVFWGLRDWLRTRGVCP